MRYRIAPALLALLVAVLALAPVASAQQAKAQPASEIQQMLEARDRQIKRVLDRKATPGDAEREQLKTLINDVIDFEAMSALALGSYWDGLTPAQRTRFVDVFSDIVRAQSLADLGIYRSTVVYDAVTVDGSTAKVVTTTTYKDVPAEVVYVMNRRDGEWLVSDIVLDAVSTAGGYARSFQAVVRKKGFDALMTSLEKKRASMQ